jgi:hypothetical protein
MRGRTFIKNKQYQQKFDGPKLYREVKVFTPVSIYEKLMSISEDRDAAMSRLIAYAIDNELDCEVPFNYEVTLPTHPRLEGAYPKQSNLIMDFLKQYPKGQPLDSLLLLRRDIGVESKDIFFDCLRELKSNDFIKFFKNNNRTIVKLTRQTLQSMGIKDIVGKGEYDDE